jgi:hypothetical protein
MSRRWLIPTATFLVPVVKIDMKARSMKEGSFVLWIGYIPCASSVLRIGTPRFKSVLIAFVILHVIALRDRIDALGLHR